MWVRITRERRFYPRPGDHRVFVHYLPGLTCSIRRLWGEALIANGDAVEVPAPPRPDRS
jgi:hypothetical protein